MVDKFLQLCGSSLIARVERAAAPARFLPTPVRYQQSPTGDFIEAATGDRGQLYRHQSLALDRIEGGANLVIATGTASGKSLCFMLPALHAALFTRRKTLVFYPQKALGSDQLSRWQVAAEACGLPRDSVGEITGDAPMSERERILENCKVILATPDVFHAWFMPQLDAPSARELLHDLAYIVIDEAHSLEGIFGTNFGLFFRRLRSARLRVAPGCTEPQVIATSATLHDPKDHLFKLTGMVFDLIDEADNGAPVQATTLLHIDGPDRGGPAEQTMADHVASLVDVMADDELLIAFADSRQGIERIVRRVNREDVKPYRAGFSRDDQREIIKELREGTLRGVGSTSALELGIDIPQFAVGLNQGVPPSRKALRQRIGRVGRARPGTFAIIAPKASFAKIGSSLEESAFGPPEPSTLYLENEVIQFQQAMCLRRECSEACPDTLLDPRLNWPDGFGQMLALAEPGSSRSKVLDEIAAIGLDNPHHAYPLRSMPALSFALKDHRTGDVIGTIDHEKALREAYPGATYYHFGTAYRVLEMRISSFECSIKLKRVKNAEPTWPILNCQVGLSFDPTELIEANLRQSPRGAFAETALRVLDTVEGFRVGNAPLYYSELNKTDRRLSRKRREFSTTGVVLRIREPWFAGNADHQIAARRSIVQALKEIAVHEYSIAPGDIRTAHTGLAQHSFAGAVKLDDAIALFDNVVGGMRLTAPLFDNFTQVLERLERGARLAGDEALLGKETVARLYDWYNSLETADTEQSQASIADGRLLIFAPDSRVAIRLRGEMIERRLIEPQIITTGQGDQLMYRYEATVGVQAWVAHDQVEPVGNTWRRALWDPASNEIELLEMPHEAA